MNFKLTAALVIVMVAIGTALYFIPAKKAEVKEEKAAPLVLSPRPTGLKTIAYSRDGEEQVAFSRGEKGWEMTFPMQGKAESWTVEKISDALLGLSYKNKFASEQSGEHSDATTGTEKPRQVVTFTEDDGKQVTVGFGKRTVGGIYATLDGGKTVYVLESDPLDSLDQPAQGFRDKDIENIDTEKVDGITVAHGDKTVTLSKSGEKWLISKPISGRADVAKVQEILGELKNVRATGFSDLAKESGATGLNPPVLSVTAMVAGAATGAPATGPATKPAETAVTLEIGYYTGLADKKNVYASMKGSKEVFTLDAKSFDKLNRELSDLRDPAISPALIGEATEATITHDGKVALKVEKKGEAWTVSSVTPAVKGSALEVGNWLGDVANLRAIKFVDNAGDLKTIGLDPPVARMEFAVPGQSQHEVILVGKAETADKVTPMMRQGEPTVYLVQTGDAEKVMATALSLRDRDVEKLSGIRMRGIAITGPAAAGGGADLVREGTTWKVTSGGKTAKADDEKLTALLAEFTPLSAVKYVAEKEESGTPDVQATVSLLESSEKPAATGPASMPAAATLPEGLGGAAYGPEQGKMVKRTLKMYKTVKGNETTWRAVWDGPGANWTFEPEEKLVEALTKESFAVAAGTQPVKVGEGDGGKR